ncbi:hypothetical protein BDY19DRAFT_915309 [Irpex rosettiformis]|uniref:Uncharacterized protein n=1 Tax=Irpex rosettiformis TaxID=378272 RepID=A0ACB8UKJ3_9APHY|nr:hypothetical protein BDY19DRAFT_915309 [Irpex rosettiformis]
MRLTSLIAALVLPLLVTAQNSTAASGSQGNSASQASQSGRQSGSVSASPTPSPIVSQVTSTIVTLSSGRQPVTITSVFNTTITPTPTATQQTSAQGNGTTSASSSSSTGPLPTAPADVDGGGQDLPGGAPHPGENKGDPRFGPDDGYISAALALSLNAVLALVGGAAVMLVLL